MHVCSTGSQPRRGQRRITSPGASEVRSHMPSTSVVSRRGGPAYAPLYLTLAPLSGMIRLIRWRLFRVIALVLLISDAHGGHAYRALVRTPLVRLDPSISSCQVCRALRRGLAMPLTKCELKGVGSTQQFHSIAA